MKKNKIVKSLLGTIKTWIKSNRQEIITLSIFLVLAFGFNVYRIESDGRFYYSFLEKVLRIAHPESSAVAIKNSFFFQSGCVFFNAPFYLVGYVLEQAFNFHININGITLRTIAINCASNFYVGASIVLTVKMLKRLKLTAILFPVLSIVFSTSVFVAAAIMPSFNHAVEIFIVTFFMFLVLKNDQENLPKPYWLGFLVVVAILVRYFYFVLLIPVALYYLYNKQYTKCKYLLIGFFACTWIVPLILFCYNGSVNVFHNTQYQHAFSRSAASISSVNVLPQYFLKYLVHPLHGILVWSPVVVLSCLGFVYLAKDNKRIGYAFFWSFILFLFMMSFNCSWYAGWSFSNRYLSGFFALYVIGLSAFISRFKKLGIFIAVILTIYSIILLLHWRLCIINAEYDTPASVVQAWVLGESDTFIDKKVTVQNFFYRLWEMCRYKYVVRLIK